MNKKVLTNIFRAIGRGVVLGNEPKGVRIDIIEQTKNSISWLETMVPNPEDEDISNIPTCIYCHHTLPLEGGAFYPCQEIVSGKICGCTRWTPVRKESNA